MTAAMYTNPVLNADWSDPDAVTVGADHYMTASTFNRVPGLPILHSRDLVTWSVVGHALPQLVPAQHFDLPRHGGGVWAPALRHHDGRFWIFYPDPDHGIFVTHATDPAGPWSTPHLLYAGRGLIDPCPLWDEDGQAYLVHGWAGSRAGVKNVLTLHRMSPDATQILDQGTTVIDGDKVPGCFTLEGPKMYRRDGWYWIFAPAGGVATGWQSVFRSRSVWGPYEERTTLVQGATTTNGPHQGAWLTDADGADWFLHFQDRGRFGRVVHLQPMSWSDEGWPLMGTAVAAGLTSAPGEPVTEHAVPASTPGETAGDAVSGDDAWAAGRLTRKWYWQANPRDDWAQLPGDSTLRLRAVPGDPGNLRQLPQVLGQRLPAQATQSTVSLRLGSEAVGARAGLVLLGLGYAWVGLVRAADGSALLTCASGPFGKEERALGDHVALPGDVQVELHVAVDRLGLARFAWRLSSTAPWTWFRGAFEVSVGAWTGADVGLFAASPLGAAAAGDAIFGPFSLTTTAEAGQG